MLGRRDKSASPEMGHTSSPPVITREGTSVHIEGLQYVRVPGDGSCLYHAIAYTLKTTHAELRERVAKTLEQNAAEYRELIDGLEEGRVREETEKRRKHILPARSFETYIKAVRDGKEWADEVEISILIKLLKRPIIVIGSDRKVRNAFAFEVSGEPIYIFYNGVDHYGALVPEHSVEDDFDDSDSDFEMGVSILIDGKNDTPEKLPDAEYEYIELDAAAKDNRDAPRDYRKFTSVLNFAEAESADVRRYPSADSMLAVYLIRLMRHIAIPEVSHPAQQGDEWLEAMVVSPHYLEKYRRCEELKAVINSMLVERELNYFRRMIYMQVWMGVQTNPTEEIADDFIDSHINAAKEISLESIENKFKVGTEHVRKTSKAPQSDEELRKDKKTYLDAIDNEARRIRAELNKQRMLGYVNFSDHVCEMLDELERIFDRHSEFVDKKKTLLDGLITDITKEETARRQTIKAKLPRIREALGDCFELKGLGDNLYVDRLLNARISADLCDATSNKSLLHIAVEGKLFHLAYRLVRSGASPFVVDALNKSVLQFLVERRSNPQCFDLLKAINQWFNDLTLVDILPLTQDEREDEFMRALIRIMEESKASLNAYVKTYQGRVWLPRWILFFTHYRMNIITRGKELAQYQLVFSKLLRDLDIDKFLDRVDKISTEATGNAWRFRSQLNVGVVGQIKSAFAVLDGLKPLRDAFMALYNPGQVSAPKFTMSHEERRISSLEAGARRLSCFTDYGKRLRTTVVTLRKENEKLREDLVARDAENQLLREKCDALDQSVAALTEKNAGYAKKFEEQEQVNAGLKADNVELKAVNAELKADSVELKADNAELKAKSAKQDDVNAVLFDSKSEQERVNARLTAELEGQKQINTTQGVVLQEMQDVIRKLLTEMQALKSSREIAPESGSESADRKLRM